MKKNKIKEINNSNEDTLYIDNYYDSKFNENFIVTCNRDHINDFVVDERGSFKNY